MAQWYVLTITGRSCARQELGVILGYKQTRDSNKSQLPVHRNLWTRWGRDYKQEALTETWICAQGVNQKVSRNYQTGTHLRPITGSYALSTQSICGTGQGQVGGARAISVGMPLGEMSVNIPLSGAALCSAEVAPVMSLTLMLFIQPSVKATNIY